MPQAEKNRGGLVIGPPHSGGGVHFILEDTGKHIEEEGMEINIPRELTDSDQIFNFYGTNASILNQILALAGLSITDKVINVRSGDIVICVRSAWDDITRKFTGTIPQILHQINTSNGCKPIISEETILAGGGAIPELNANGGYDYSGESKQIAKMSGLVTLPRSIKGTNCGNCIFNNNNFCDHRKVLVPVTSRMCCSLWDDKSFRSHLENIWDANFFADKEKQFPMNSDGGYNYSGKALDKARAADLITLPPKIEGTNCASKNCMYRKDSMCIHPKINLPVTNRMSCAWWDNKEVIRTWGAPVEMEFYQGGPIPAIRKEKDWQAENPDSPRWKKKKESIQLLSNNIHRLRLKVGKDIQSEDERTALTALVIAIMDRTAERIGNDDSADNGHFGVTGFRKDHIRVVGNKVHLDYVGKSGTKHDKNISDLRISKALKKAIKNAPGKFIFETSDGFRIKSDRVNRYLEPFHISAKDLRGYNANRWIIDLLKKADGKWQLQSDNKKARKERKKIFNKAVKETASRVGHGASTLKKHYMIPELPVQYIDHGIIIDMKNIGYYLDGGPLGDLRSENYFENKNEVPNIVNQKTEEIYLEAQDEGIDKLFNAQVVKVVDWKDVVPTQDFLRTSKFHKLEGVEDIYSINLPWAVEYEGKYYINDGHHRAVVMHQRNIPIKLHVYPIESEQTSKTNNMKNITVNEDANKKLNEGGKIDYPKDRLPVVDQSIEERELQLFIENDADLYRQRTVPIQTNLVTKIARGIFDINKAPLIYKYLIDDGIKKYNKELGPGMELSKAEKDNLAKTFVNEFLDEAQYGNYENYLPKKYKMNEGGNTDTESEDTIEEISEDLKENLNQEDIIDEPNDKPETSCMCFSTYIKRENPELVEKMIEEDVNSNPKIRAQVDKAYKAWNGGKM